MLNCYKQKKSKRKFYSGELFIFDVRNENDYEDWKIEGNNSSINEPYFELLDGVEGIMDKFLGIKKF